MLLDEVFLQKGAARLRGQQTSDFVKIFLGQDSIHSQFDQVLFHLNGWPLLSHEQYVDCPVRIESVFPPLFDS